MANFTFEGYNPRKITVAEAGKITLPAGVQEVTFRVFSGTAQLNSKQNLFTESPSYTPETTPVVIRDSGDIFFTSADNAVVSFEL